MGQIEGHHHEEWIPFLFFYILNGVINHHGREIFSASPNFFIVVVEVVVTIPVHEVMPIVFYKTGQVAEVMIKSLIERPVAHLGSEVPLAK